MGNTSLLWPEVEVKNSGSGCAHEIEIKRYKPIDIQFLLSVRF
jgi:hypothetical protein